jgi:hypothetical protein
VNWKNFGENERGGRNGLIVSVFSANKQWGQFSVFSFQQEPADSRRYTNGSTIMPRKRCTGRALAQRRRRAMRLYLAEFSQEEIADKLGIHRSVVCRDLQWIRDSICPGESPDVQEAYFIQIERMIFNPGPGQFDPRHPPLDKSMSPEDAAASWKDRKIFDLTVDGYGPQLKL